jgi:hypothetical protein
MRRGCLFCKCDTFRFSSLPLVVGLVGLAVVGTFIWALASLGINAAAEVVEANTIVTDDILDVVADLLDGTASIIR